MTTETETSTPPPVPAAAPPLPKRPLLAAIFAFFPGLGHVYNGLYQRAITFFALFVAAIFLVTEAEIEILGVAIAFLWFFNVLDSYRQATLINLGYATDLGLLERPRRLRPGQGALIAGVALFAVGALELLHRADLWQWRWLAEYWPIPFMAVGAWLVVAALRERARQGVRSNEVYPELADDDASPIA